MPPAKKSASGRKAPASKASKAPAKAAAKKAAPTRTPALKAPAPKAAPRAPALSLVPDTSVLVDGRLTQRIQANEISHCRILIPNAAVAELEAQANQGRETGFAGLDEVVKIQELKDVADLEVEFVGNRPSASQVGLASGGEIDAMIRQVAVDNRAKLLTSDRVQAHVARALGLDVEWIRPLTEPKDIKADLDSLGISQFFDERTMSVHLKQNVVPLAKKGSPAGVELVRLSDRPMELRELTRMRREIIEAARRDDNSFIEIERNGATVVQLGRMRIAIAQPPFSDAVEITAVRPVVKLDFESYNLPDELRRRLLDHHRGVFVSGAPGSGKSTFVTAVAEWLKGHEVIVKTMESPRDLQVSDDITQYAPLDKDMALTSDVLLLVRPDFVVYDEVRKTSDFEVFADMRLAGVGLVGVTHANRAIDAVQRLIGRVELGMIPQVVDTVVHIAKGQVQQVLDLNFTVKTPAGMTEADLARPVIEVRDFLSRQVEFEIYTYGEQVVVMPVGDQRRGGGAKRTGKDRHATEGLKNALRRFVEGPFEVEITGENQATLFVSERLVPMIIGRGGSNVKVLEQAIGMKVDVRPMAQRKPDWAGGRGGSRDDTRSSARDDDRGGGGSSSSSSGARTAGRFDPARPLRREVEADEDEVDEDSEDFEDDAGGSASGGRRYATVRPELRKSKKNLVLLLRKEYAGERVQVVVEDEAIMTATVSGKGEVRVARNTDAGERIMDAVARGEIVTVRI